MPTQVCSDMLLQTSCFRGNAKGKNELTIYLIIGSDGRKPSVSQHDQPAPRSLSQHLSPAQENSSNSPAWRDHLYELQAQQACTTLHANHASIICWFVTLLGILDTAWFTAMMELHERVICPGSGEQIGLSKRNHQHTIAQSQLQGQMVPTYETTNTLKNSSLDSMLHAPHHKQAFKHMRAHLGSPAGSNENFAYHCPYLLWSSQAYTTSDSQPHAASCRPH